MIPILIAGSAGLMGNSEYVSGGRVWVGAIFWVPFCLISAVVSFLWLNDMPHHGNEPVVKRIW
jgi:hypothetical protein